MCFFQTFCFNKIIFDICFILIIFKKVQGGKIVDLCFNETTIQKIAKESKLKRKHNDSLSHQKKLKKQRWSGRSIHRSLSYPCNTDFYKGSKGIRQWPIN